MKEYPRNENQELFFAAVLEVVADEHGVPAA